MARAAKKQVRFVCRECGSSSARWLGRCATCNQWNTLVEERVRQPREATERAGSGPRPGAVRLTEVPADQARHLPTGLQEFDRVLGGGLVAGGVYLVAGDPGIGKSTLMMQVLAALAHQDRPTLYVTGEESAAQVALRGLRLAHPGMDQVRILATTALDDVEESLATERPAVAVIDSIQTLRCDLDSPSGSLAQLREVATRLIGWAKEQDVSMLLIGHVTKEGVIAGPKVLEHQVDAVLAFEGDQTHAFRLLRATKNRFGPTQEIGVFEMMAAGLKEVPDPSALFLAERPTHTAGSLVVPTAQGSRPVLMEIQALVAPAVYGAARRVASGIDANRLAILLAVLERKAEVHVLDRDVFASVAGGARVEERAVDLALAVAVVSSLRNCPVVPDLALFGEVGLAGEVRAVPRPAPRIAEARKLGFRTIIMPRGNAERLTADQRQGVEIHPVATLAQALEAAL